MTSIKPIWVPKRTVLGLLAAALAALATSLLALLMGGWTLTLFLGGALVAALGAYFLVTLVGKPGRLFLIFVATLPVYTLSLALLYRFSRSELLVNSLQSVKELLSILVLVSVILFSVARLRFKRFHALDGLVLLYLGLNLLYLLVPWGPDLGVRLYGAKANTFFVALYFLGRFVPLSRGQQRWALGILIGVGALAGLMVLVEIVALPANWPVFTGLMDYLEVFFGITPRGHYGLTWTFETATGLRRRSAFFANPLELASATLITGAAAAYAMFHFRRRTWGRLLATVALALITLSLLLSVSRSSMIAFVLEMFVISLVLRKHRFTLLLLGVGVLGAIALFIVGDERVFVLIWETITFQNPSSQGHLLLWIEGARSLLEQPLGLGLGTSGQIGSRFGSMVGGENQLVIIGVELGLFGLLLYVSIVLSSIWLSLGAFRRSSGVTRALAFVAAVARLALLLPTFTSHIEIYTFAMYTTWWLVGFAVQQLTVLRPEARGLARNLSAGEASVAYSD